MRSTGSYEDAVDSHGHFRAFVPEPLPPKSPPLQYDDELHNLLGNANHALGRLSGVFVSGAKPNENLQLYSYIRKEAVLSSQIEGTQSSLSDLLLFENEAVPGVPVDDVEETANYIKAIEHGLATISSGKLPISSRLIRQMHRLLLTNSRGASKSPGQFRRSSVWLGGDTPQSARFVPPQWHHIEGLIADLESFIHADESVDPLVKAAMAHAQFETIHPFLDGNGRVGRILIPLILFDAKRLPSPAFYISLYFKKHRDAYYDALQAIRIDGDWERWLKYFLRGVEGVADNVFTSTERLHAMVKADMENVLQNAGKSPVTQHVFSYAASQVMLTSRTAQAAVNGSKPSVNDAIGRLERLGILSEVTGKRRNRIWVYSDYMDILNEN